MHNLSWFKRYVLVLFKFLVCFFPLLAGRFSDFHLTQNRKKHYYGLNNYINPIRELKINKIDRKTDSTETRIFKVISIGNNAFSADFGRVILGSFFVRLCLRIYYFLNSY